MQSNVTANFSTFVNMTHIVTKGVKLCGLRPNSGPFKYFLPEEIFAGLNIYYTPVLIVVGTIGNLVSLYVFHTNNLKHQSASVYLSGLAVSDTLFLLQLFPPWLDAVQHSSIFYIPAVCYTVSYVSYVTCSLSTWIVVAFTVERCFAVIYPVKSHLICSAKLAKIIVFCITCTVMVLNLPVLKLVSPAANCSIDSEYLAAAAKFNVIDTVISFTVPLAAIIMLNLRIMYGVFKLEHERERLRLILQVGTSATPMGNPVLRPQHRITRMLLIVSSVFVIFNLPGYTMRILAYTYGGQLPEGGGWTAFQQIASLLFNTSFGMNFMLYCLSGSRFRRALCKLIPFLRRWYPDPPPATANVPIPSISASVASADVELGHNVNLETMPETQNPVRRNRWASDNICPVHQQERIEMSAIDMPSTSCIHQRIERLRELQCDRERDFNLERELELEREYKRELQSQRRRIYPRRHVHQRRVYGNPLPRTLPYELVPHRHIVMPNFRMYVDPN